MAPQETQKNQQWNAAFKKGKLGTSQVVQWLGLTSNAGGCGQKIIKLNVFKRQVKL